RKPRPADGRACIQGAHPAGARLRPRHAVCHPQHGYRRPHGPARYAAQWAGGGDVRGAKRLPNRAAAYRLRIALTAQRPARKKGPATATAKRAANAESNNGRVGSLLLLGTKAKATLSLSFLRK